MYALRIITPPAVEPVTLAEARAQARIDHTLEDAVLAGYILSAREVCEHELQAALIARTYELTLPGFPSCGISLPMGPVPGAPGLTIASVKYTDSADVEQTVAPSAYVLVLLGVAPSIRPVTSWPAAKAVPDAVRVRYTSGHADASCLPQAIRQWILMQVAHLNEQREAAGDKPLTPGPFVDRLLDPYRTYR